MSKRAGSRKQEARRGARIRQGAGFGILRLCSGQVWNPSAWLRTGLGFIICNSSFVICLLWRALFAGEAFFWGTPLLQFVPWQRMAAALWRGGHLPLWNPLVGCGAPLAANYQTAAFYPLNVLYLLLPAEVALSWTTALHLALAGWGMYSWCRAVRLDRFPAFIGAISLSGSGFLVARAALFPSIVFTFPWLVIWLWRAEVLVRRGRLRDVLSLGLSLGLGLLAGHAQTAFYGGLLLVAYLAFRTLQEAGGRKQEAGGRKQEAGGRKQEAGGRKQEAGGRKQEAGGRRQEAGGRRQEAGGRRQEAGGRRQEAWDWSLVIGRWSLIVCSLVIGLGLAAVQLLPTAELMRSSQRSAGVNYDLAMTYSLWPWRLITFVAPDFFGNPGRGDYWGYATYWEDAGYVGVLPLLLAMEAVLSRKRGREGARVSLLRFWAACVAITLVLALGQNTPVFPFLFRHVPSFDLFQSPARWLAITTIALAALAALGAQWWPVGHRGRRRGALWVVIGMALLIGGLAAPRLVPSVRPTFGLATARLGGTMLVAGVLVLLRRPPSLPPTGGDERGGHWGGGRGWWWRVAVGGFVALDLLLASWSLAPTVDRSLYHGDTQVAAFLRGEPGPVRVYWPTDPTHVNREYDAEQRVKFGYLAFDDFGPRDVDYWWGMREALLPNVGMLDSVASANNFEPLLVGRYAALLEAAVETPELLRVMGVTHVVSDRPWPGEEIAHVSGPAVYYRLSDAPGRAWVVPAARQVSPDEMLAALADSAFDPTAEVLLEQPVSNIQHPTSNIQYQVALQDTPNRVTIHAILDAPGYLVLADTWYPGWQAAVDGEPVELVRANYVFRAVALDAGDHVVEMLYRPLSLRVGAVVSLGVLIVLLTVWLVRRQGEETGRRGDEETRGQGAA